MTNDIRDTPYTIELHDIPPILPTIPIARIEPSSFSDLPTTTRRKNSCIDVCTIIIIILYSIPTLIVGVVYKSQCPAQEWIPRFMIVQGTVACVSIILTILFIIVIKIDFTDKITICAFITFSIYFILELLFTFGWLIAGSVWTFSIKKDVQFDNPQGEYYCHRTAYQYAFALLILFYIITFLRCCYKLGSSLTH